MFECKIRPHKFRMNIIKRIENFQSQVQKDVFDELKSNFLSEETLYMNFYFTIIKTFSALRWIFSSFYVNQCFLQKIQMLDA